ncbi:MAG: Mur ligase family protein [Spirochaetota bacterium]
MYNKILSKYINNELRTDFLSFDLQHVKQLLEKLNNPHLSFKSVHIAGTNGKGTTSSFIASTLYSSGYKTGLYTSPHLLKLNERIKINNKEIPDDAIYKYALKIDNIIIKNPELKPTYFDILTAIAFLYFADEKIDVAVVETGLGGKLDSTNILMPLVSVITEISIDHASVLGNTIELIAEEKAGIIKKNIPVISSCTSKQAVDIISKTALSCGSIHYALSKDFNYSNIKANNSGYTFNYLPPKPWAPINDLYISVRPKHHVQNASAAATALLLLKNNGFPKITVNSIVSAFAGVTLKGRFQILQNNPFILFDAAHNYDALNNLLAAVKKYYQNKKLHIILSIMADKITPKIKELLYQHKDSILYFKFIDERIYIPEQDEFSIITSDINRVKEFVFSEADENPVNLFTGTFRLYKYVLDMIGDKENGARNGKR